MKRPNPTFWRGRRVLLTGHTGFKGAWLALWLERMGAQVTGFALPSDPLSLFEVAGVEASLLSITGDMRDRRAVRDAVAEAQADIVIHMAAQALVRRSFREPVETFETNVIGTANLLDALWDRDMLKAVLVVTSDKVYANNDSGKAFRESDPLGGDDPYSASKAAQEHVVASFAKSLLTDCAVATARAGNVIGGGDFAEDRLIPDIIRAIEAGERVELRNPRATRPWQHVLDAVAGYLVYIEALVGGVPVPRALNFGPADAAAPAVEDITRAMQIALGQEPDFKIHTSALPEKAHLSVDASLAKSALGYTPGLTTGEAVEWTADWYRAWRAGEDARAVTLAQIEAYETL